MKNKQIIIVTCFVFLFLSASCFSQDTIQEQKPVITVYPSVSGMYGFLFYKLERGDKNPINSRFYNNNYCFEALLNSDIKFNEVFSLQVYAGYNKWQLADLYPVGIMLKQKINQKQNEAFLKLGGGYTFGKRYDDPNELRRPGVMPKDYGSGNVNINVAIEKKYYFIESQAISVGFKINFQFIKSYYAEYHQTSSPTTFQPYFIPYKFAGLTLAYHFY